MWVTASLPLPCRNLRGWLVIGRVARSRLPLLRIASAAPGLLVLVASIVLMFLFGAGSRLGGLVVLQPLVELVDMFGDARARAGRCRERWRRRRASRFTLRLGTGLRAHVSNPTASLLGGAGRGLRRWLVGSSSHQRRRARHAVGPGIWSWRGRLSYDGLGCGRGRRRWHAAVPPCPAWTHLLAGDASSRWAHSISRIWAICAPGPATLRQLRAHLHATAVLATSRGR